MKIDVEDFLHFLSKEKAALTKIISDTSVIDKQKSYWMYVVGKRDALQQIINGFRRVDETSKRTLEPVIGFSAEPPVEEVDDEDIVSKGEK